MSHLAPTDPAGEPTVTDEQIIATSADAHSIPVWSTPISLGAYSGSYSLEENVRAEIQDNSGEIIGRLVIGASATWWGYPRAILVNAPDAGEAFTKGGYRSLGHVRRLVPDSYAFVNIDTIWIDLATANDTALTDNFWRQVLLNGTIVVGHADAIELLSQRLGLPVNQPGLPGKLIEAESPAAFIDQQGPLVPASNYGVTLSGEIDPFEIKAGKIGADMHRQLLSYSEAYLAIFLVLQALVIVVGFAMLRGPQRVWLWLWIPCFAVVYTAAGIVLAYVAVPTRVEARLPEVEVIRQGWPQSLLLSRVEEIRLAPHDTLVDLPAGSRPFPTWSQYNPMRSSATFNFFHTPDAASLTIQAQPATLVGVDVRSILTAPTPCKLEEGRPGSIRALRDFSGAWLWEGLKWHDLGPLKSGQVIDWQSARVIRPGTSYRGRAYNDGQHDDNIPAILKPMFAIDTVKALDAPPLQGEAVFIGIEPAADLQIRDTTVDAAASHRVVAYQFQLWAPAP